MIRLPRVLATLEPGAEISERLRRYSDRLGKAFISLKADNENLNGLSILRIERNSGELKQGIEIKAGEDILDLRIMIADGTGVIRGQVKVEGGTLPAGARMTASISNQLRFANGYAQVDDEGRFVISGLAAGTYEVVLNIFSPPPRQAVRLLPTMKQTVNVTDANESSVVFTVVLANQCWALHKKLKTSGDIEFFSAVLCVSLRPLR